MDIYYRANNVAVKRFKLLKRTKYVTTARSLTHVRLNIWAYSRWMHPAMDRYISILVQRGEIREICADDAWGRV